MSKKVATLGQLPQYLEHAELGHDFYLNDSRTMSFHWADSDATCWWLGNSLKKNQKADARYSQLQSQMEDLKSEEIWVRDKTQVRSVSLFDFFCSQIDPQYLNIDFKRPDVMVSTLGPQGEYFNVGINGIPEAARFEDFIHHKVIASEVPWRKFRLRTDMPLMCSIQGQADDCCILLVRQLTTKGLLIFIPSAAVFQRLLAMDYVHADIDVPGIKSILTGDAQAMNSSQEKSSNRLGANPQKLYRIELTRSPLAPPHLWMMDKLWGRGQRFIFVPYTDIHREDGQGQLGDILGPLLSEMEHEVAQITKKSA